jgi:hypothetical protein
MPLRGPEVTSFSFVMRAEGVRGGVRRRRERVVVCDFRSVVLAVMTERGSGISVVEICEAGVVFFGGARENW